MKAGMRVIYTTAHQEWLQRAGVWRPPHEYKKIHPWEVLNILDDTSPAKDEELPDTGVGLELERILSPIFIKWEKYGTRSSTIVTVDKNNNVRFVEKAYFGNTGRFSNRDFNFIINKK